MTKKELVENVWVTVRMEKGIRESRTHRKLPITRTQTRVIVDTVLSNIGEALERGEEITLPRFGRFYVKVHPEGSMVMDISTGKKVPRSPDRMRTLRFKPSHTIVERINQASTVTA